MAVLAGVAGLKIPPEGRLAVHPLEKLLGLLGAVEATCVVDLTRRKLVRRVVLDRGRIQALVSNARDDRLLEWLMLHESLRPLSSSEMAELEEATLGKPLVAEVLVVRGLVSLEALPDCQRQHAVGLLSESATWSDATFQIRPGKVQIGSEPPLNWPAQAAALTLIRSQKPVTGALPAWVAATTGGDRLGELPLDDLERAVLVSCVDPLPGDRIRTRIPDRSPKEVLEAATRLLRSGLLVETQPPPETAGDMAELDEASLKEWLGAAQAENLHALLGVKPRESTEDIRKAYYRTVRRFHPDRFRQGPLSSYYKQVEDAFRLVHEALAVLTDPAAAARWEKRRAPVGPATAPSVPQDMLVKVKAMVAAGRRAEAVEVLERSLKIDPGRKDLILALGLLLASNPRRRQEAVDKLTGLAKEDALFSGAAFALGTVLRKAGQTGEAQQWFTRASQGDPSDSHTQAARRNPEALRQFRNDPLWAPLL